MQEDQICEKFGSKIRKISKNSAKITKNHHFWAKGNVSNPWPVEQMCHHLKVYEPIMVYEVSNESN